MSRKRLRQLDLSEIAAGCRQESDRFRAGQPGEEGHCFELFRRAIEEGDQEAWGAIYAQYRQLVARWIGGHQAGDELIESTFVKFWRAAQRAPLTSLQARRRGAGLLAQMRLQCPA